MLVAAALLLLPRLASPQATNLSLTKSAPMPAISAGDTAYYALTLTNQGPATANNVVLADQLPAGLAWATSSPGCAVVNGGLICPFGQMTVGQQRPVLVGAVAPASSCGSLYSVATVSAQNAPAVGIGATITVQCPDLVVSTSAGSASYSAGETAHLGFTVRNNASGTARNVTASATLPPGVTWVDDSASCSIDGRSLGCAFGDLAPGQLKLFGVTGVTDRDDCGRLAYSFTAVAGNEAAGALADDTSSTSFDVNCPSFTLLVVPDAASVSAGDPVGFTMKITNDGPGKAFDVGVFANLPVAGLHWSNTPSTAGCELLPGGRSAGLLCTFGTMLPGAAKSVHVVSPTIADSCGAIETTVSVVSRLDSETVPHLEVQRTGVIAVQCPALQLLHAPAAGSIAGGPVGYLLEVRNLGAGFARGVSLGDPLPSGGSNLAWQIKSQSGSACGIHLGLLTCAIGDMAPSSVYQIELSALTTAADCGTLPSTASVAATNAPSIQQDATILVDCPDLALTTTADAGSVSAGQVAAFSMRVTNLRTGVSFGTSLVDTLPSGIAWTTTFQGCSISSTTMTCNLSGLDGGASQTVHVSGRTGTANCGALVNSAVVSATNEPSGLAGNNASSASLQVNCSSIGFSKTADAASVSAGAAIGFTISLNNDGAGTASGVLVSDPLPTNSGLSWKLDAGGAAGSCAIASGVLSCDIGDLAPLATRTVHLSSSTTSATCGTVSNLASLTSANSGTAQASASIQVNCSALQLTKTADAATVNAGSPIGFTMTVTNAGAGTAEEVTLTDVLPKAAGLSFAIAGGSGAASCGIASGTLICAFGNLAPSATATVRVSSPTTDLSCGTIANTASLAASGAASGQASASVQVVCAPPPPPPSARTRLLPIVLDVATAGAHFTTELALTNRGDATLPLRLDYTSSIGASASSGTVKDQLGPGQQRRISDVIAYLRGKGLPIPAGSQGGTLLVSFDTPPAGERQALATAPAEDLVSATARTTTATASPQPAGAAGLAYSGLLGTQATSASAAIYGLRSSAADRSNLAVFNTGDEPVTFKVTVFSGAGDARVVVFKSAETLPPHGWTQYNSPDLLDGTGIANGYALIERLGTTGTFGAYGVINDQKTSDGSFLLPVRGSFSGTSLTVPVLVETAVFRSELTLSNRSSLAATLVLDYTESLSPTGGHGGKVTVLLPAGQQQIIPEAIDFLRQRGLAIGTRGAGSHAGALRVTVSGAPIGEVFAGARTAAQSPSPSGGQFGLFTPAVYPGQEASEKAYLFGLRSDAENRSNVAVLNAGRNEDGPVLLELQAFDGDAAGASSGAPLTLALNPGEWAQPGGFFGASGVNNGWVVITRRSGTAPWIAYAVINDGGAPGERTNDGAYVPMAR